MKHVAIYYRVSTTDQDITSQIEQIDAYTNDMITKVYRDDGISGYTTKRPGYQAMLRAVEAREVSMVVVFALDRLGRNSLDSVEQLIRFERLDVDFVSVTQPQFSSGNPLRRTMLSLFAELAEIEHHTISNRVKAGMKANRNNKLSWGPPTMLTPDFLLTVQSLREGGQSIRAIASQLSVSHGLIQKALKRLAA